MATDFVAPNLIRLRKVFLHLRNGPSSPDPLVVASMAPLPSNDKSFKQAVLQPRDLIQPQPRPVRRNESRAAVITRRFNSMRHRSTAKDPICYKCGSRGHFALGCRNAQLCLLCNKHGHKSHECSVDSNHGDLSSTLKSDKPPPPTHFPDLANSTMASPRYPISIFNPTPESEKLLSDFHKSFILSDVANWGPDKVNSTIHRTFDKLPWSLTIFDEKKYLIQAPTKEWQQSMTRKGLLRLDGVKFPVVAWEPKFSEGKKLTSLWVKVHGYPHLLWQWGEVDRMLTPMGAVLLEMDPGAGQRCDWRFVRIRIGICKRELLPSVHWMLHRDVSGYVSSSELRFEVKSERPDSLKGGKGGIRIPQGGAPPPPTGGGPTANRVVAQPPPPPPPPSFGASASSSEMQTEGLGKAPITDTGCHMDQFGYQQDDSDSSDGEGLRAHYKKYYGGANPAEKTNPPSTET